MPRKTNTTHIKWERALQLTVQLNLTKNRRYIFTDCYRKRSKWIAAIETSGLQSAKGGFSFGNMLNLGVKPYPYILL